MKNIKKLRLDQGLTQLAVQMKTGIDQALLSKYENNERLPTTENLIVLADFYGVNIDFLLDRTDDSKLYIQKTIAKK